MWRRLFNARPRLTDQRVIDASVLIARRMEDGLEEPAQIEALRAAGFDAGEAHRFVAFLPSAFSRPVLEEFGVRVSPTMSIPTPEGGDVKARLDRQPEYVAGLALARRHRQSGCMPHWAYVTITKSSAEIDAISNALNAEAKLEGAVVASAVVGTCFAEYVVT